MNLRFFGETKGSDPEGDTDLLLDALVMMARSCVVLCVNRRVTQKESVAQRHGESCDGTNSVVSNRVEIAAPARSPRSAGLRQRRQCEDLR